MVFQPGERETTVGTTATGAPGALSFTADGGFAFGGASFSVARSYPVASGLSLYRAAGLDEAATRSLVKSLEANPQVKSAFPNWVLSATALPNDTLYPLQEWHYGQLNLPAAWDVETGATEKVTVAVLDTGMFDHPDVQWAAAGANFANWTGTEPGEGEGPIDDPHTVPGGNTHGTHVAGTIGAVTDNGSGVAGVNWNVDVMPVKVLGANGSSTTAGILEGLIWVTGYDDPAYGGWVNTNIPRVVNMSLGGNHLEPCPEPMDDLFAELASLRITTVVSAGNSGLPFDTYFPSSCPSVITVGATGPTGARAYYSSFGLQVDVMAPGGDEDYDHPANPAYWAGILSTMETDSGPGYGFLQGTSMAAPHVAGVVSLMVAREPSLTTAQIRERLHNASVPLTKAECWANTAALNDFNLCGAGLLDAAAAVLGETAATPTAFVYALPYVDDAPPAFGLGSLPSIPGLAHYQVEATSQGEGVYTFTLDGVEPGTYSLLGVEYRDSSAGISGTDRVAFAQVVEVTAGGTAEVDLDAEPIYSFFK